jgi:hypothetical protein
MKPFHLIGLLIVFVLLQSCKKSTDLIAGSSDSSTVIVHGSPNLHAFNITIDTVSTTTASIKWTDAGDYQSDSVRYTLILGGNQIASKLNGNQYQISGLAATTSYHLEIKASVSEDKFVMSTIDFKTDDGYLKFEKSLYYNVVPYDMVISPDNDYVISLSDPNQVNGGVMIVKLDTLGNEIWKKTFSYDGSGSKIKLATDGYLIVGANYLLKLDFNGVLLWYKTFAGTGTWFASCTITSNNEIVVTGFDDQGLDSVNISRQASILMFSSNGKLIWRKRYGTGKYNEGCDIIATGNSDGYFVLCSTDESDNSQALYWLLKIDNSGNLTWDKTFASPYYAIPKTIVRINDNLIIGGNGFTVAYGGEMEVFRTDLDGNILKSIVVQPIGFYTRLNTLKATTDRGYIVCGAVDQDASSTLLALFKYDSSDNLIWSNTYTAGFNYWTNSYTIMQTSDEGFIVAGTKFQLYGDYSDLWLLKLNPSGLDHL